MGDVRRGLTSHKRTRHDRVSTVDVVDGMCELVYFKSPTVLNGLGLAFGRVLRIFFGVIVGTSVNLIDFPTMCAVRYKNAFNIDKLCNVW